MHEAKPLTIAKLRWLLGKATAAPPTTEAD
jgi:hypothetical protein